MLGLTDNISAAARAETREITDVLETVDSDNEEEEEQGNNSGSDDHSSSDRSGSGSSTSNTGSTKSTDGSLLGFWNWAKGNSKNEYNVGQKESRYVGYLKLVVIAVIVVSGVFMARATYHFMVDEQAADFYDEFWDISSNLISESVESARNMQLGLHAESVAITSLMQAKGEVWPFVTVPHFELKGQDLIKQTGAGKVYLSIVVGENQREEWEEYTTVNQGWVREGLVYQGQAVEAPSIVPYIHLLEPNPETPGLKPDPGTTSDRPFYVPVWQIAPAPTDQDINFVNYNLFAENDFQADFDVIRNMKHAVLSKSLEVNDEFPYPRSAIHQPIFKGISYEGEPVGLLSSVVPWESFFVSRIASGTDEIVLVLSNECNQTFTYFVNGPDVTFAGEGDIHDPIYDEMAVSADFSPFDDDAADSSGGCRWTVHIYPSSDLEDSYDSNQALVFTVGVAFIFFLVCVCFITYDSCVERRQKKNVTSAVKSNAIISSLFPAQVRERLLDDAANDADDKNKLSQKASDMLNTPGQNKISSKPIADLFPNCTVLFADIVGFTAWSSVREPAQVFILLESVYHAFDRIAKKRRVFKVETIGDCYVAVVGLPDPRKNHAVVMGKFAHSCLVKMKEIVRKLEVTLGPDTGDLSMRFGLHSGPVTAGVLRGEKSRFQLFGDTVNTASRMESTGQRGKIHISKETADLITADGKSQWVKPRDKAVVAKGKGELQTFWLELKAGSVLSDPNTADSAPDTENSGEAAAEDLSGMLNGTQKESKTERLVSWHVDVLTQHLKKMVAMRDPNGRRDPFIKTEGLIRGGTVLDEVQEIITLPSQVVSNDIDIDGVQVDDKVRSQLRTFVSRIGSMYRDNSFHCFEHASHVTMSVTKLLSRVVTPSDVDYSRRNALTNSTDLHEYTYGITSDPLTQFAVAFSALIHDVDHVGVPNSQLVKEKTKDAIRYNNKSVAEQNSVDLSWNLLMEPQFRELRECICYTRAEQKRFRQLVVNAVMATDITDKELGALRRARWDRAFQQIEQPLNGDLKDTDRNRKATIVIEHLIQASDVSHTMQHWHIYQKWNQKFFNECYKAYVDGRADKDPSEGWYEGELGFFDFYIIPLAKKLKECGCFGVSCDEYLNYATANRKEWEAKGKAVVKGYLADYKQNEVGNTKKSSA